MNAWWVDFVLDVACLRSPREGLSSARYGFARRRVRKNQGSGQRAVNQHPPARGGDVRWPWNLSSDVNQRVHRLRWACGRWRRRCVEGGGDSLGGLFATVDAMWKADTVIGVAGQFQPWHLLGS